VLLDVAAPGVDILPRTSISPGELDDVARAEGVEVGSGDIVVVRTGWWANFLQTRDGEAWTAGSPGVGWRVAEWLHDKECAAIACDNIAVEVSGAEVEGVLLAFHLQASATWVDAGEMWNLEELSQTAPPMASTSSNRWRRIEVTGAVGSPINPLALK
jgi:kynurenine formamidase